MDRRQFLALTSSVGAITLAGCSSASGNSASSTTPASGGQSTVTVQSTSKYGKILATTKGMTLYGFRPDKPNKSTCYGQCAKMWPPYMNSSPTGSSNVKATLGTTTRKDGSKQVTVNTWPVYTFVKDKKPGQAIGHGMNMNGGLWFVLDPYGNEVRPTKISH